MPTPLAHSAVALASSRAAGRPKPSRRMLALFVLLANLPDVDLLPGFIAGFPLQYHHGWTHSAVFAFAAALLFALIPWEAGNAADARPYRFRFLCLLGVALSHPFMDLFTVDKPGVMQGMDPGMALWWPFTAHRIAPLYGFFDGTVLTLDWRDWLVPNNLREFAFEIVFGASLIVVVRRATRRIPGAAAPDAAPSEAATAAVPSGSA